MTEHHEPAPQARPRDGKRPLSVRIGITVFVVGLIFVLVTVVPFFWGVHNRPVWLNVACMLAPIGFIVAVVGAVRNGRADQRSALAQLRSR